MGGQDRTVEQVIDRAASRTHGVVTRRQLFAAGITKREVDLRLAKGSLIGVHRGVYRVGHRAPSLFAHYLGAVFAGGQGTLLSANAAAYLLALVRGKPPAPEIITRTERSIAGVVTHRTRRVDRADAWSWQGVPCTTVPRTLVDLAATLGPEALARACHEASVRYRTTPGHVEAVLDRRPTSPGAASLRRVLRGDTHVTLSVLEARFLALLRDAGLPLPVTNRPAGGRYVDSRWREQRLTVELDSYRYHGSRHAWEKDRRREREAYARGEDFRRYTYGDVTEHPYAMLGELRPLLLDKHPA